MQTKGSIRDILVVPLRAFSGAQRSLLTGRCLAGVVQPIPAWNSGALLGIWLKGAKNWKRSGKAGSNFSVFSLN